MRGLIQNGETRIDSNAGSPSGFVKALAYLAHDYMRTGFTRASAYFTVSLKALESRNLTENQHSCQDHVSTDHLIRKWVICVKWQAIRVAQS